MGPGDIAIVALTAAQVRHRRGELASLLADAIEGGASLGYLLPVQRRDLDGYWAGIADEVGTPAACTFYWKRLA